MGLAFGYFNEFWWFFCFKNSGFVFNERVGLYFYDKRVASPFSFMVEENLMISWTRIIIPQGVNVPINTSSRHYESNLHQATRIVIQTSQDIYFQNEIDYGYP